MKKSALLILSLLLSTANAQAAVPPVTPPTAYVAPGAYYGGPKFVPFTSAVAFAVFVIYANANGIPFPLCGVSGLNCYAQYPTGKNGQ